MSNIHQPVCTVVPPHMMRSVAEHGDPRARQTVITTIQHTTLIAERRVVPFVRAAAEGQQRGINRRIHDAEHRLTVRGRLIMSERMRSTDVEAVEAFEGCGATYDFYWERFRRNSIDDRGMRLDSTIHYGESFDNAMWDGREMIYGDGDGELFRRFTAAPDVIAHELTHGVTQYTANLDYRGQSGALNEHVSDAFGILVKQYSLGQTAGQSNWLIGEGLFTDLVNGVAIRSMKAPGTAYDDPVLGKDPQPAHMRDYVQTSDDHGGVHINSGIPNRAFFLAADAIGGYAWETLGDIWYAVLATRLRARAQFADMARETVSMAGRLFGSRSLVQQSVSDAWEAVGVSAPIAARGRRAKRVRRAA